MKIGDIVILGKDDEGGYIGGTVDKVITLPGCEDVAIIHTKNGIISLTVSELERVKFRELKGYIR